MTELEIKQQAVVDAKAAYAIAADHAAIAYDAWTKARLELSDYLKEHGDEHSI
tara:strand:- start:1524 stop:1682 length:159 start_codon:yes stop_codon:yes gene_type:complete